MHRKLISPGVETELARQALKDVMGHSPTWGETIPPTPALEWGAEEGASEAGVLCAAYGAGFGRKAGPLGTDMSQPYSGPQACWPKCPTVLLSVAV